MTDSVAAPAQQRVAAAKNTAERIYPGSSARWIDAQVSEAEALRFLDEAVADHRCSFCGKAPYEINDLFEGNNVRICDFCIAEFHRLLTQFESK